MSTIQNKSKPNANQKSQSSDFVQFQISHCRKKDQENPGEITNTKIGDSKLGVQGGSYTISDEEYPAFLEMYYDQKVAKGQAEHFTEKQLEKGAILVDIDLRFASSVSERLLSQDHIVDLVDGYLGEIQKIYHLDEDTHFPIYVYQKETINRVAEKDITKDGLHLVIGIKADRSTQMYLRSKMVEQTKEMWDGFPITNTWEDVFDDGISKGHTNWQLHGSSKPGYQTYKLVDIYDIKFDPTDGEFIQHKIPVPFFDQKANIYKLSARYPNHYEPFMRAEIATTIKTQNPQNAKKNTLTNTIVSLSKSGPVTINELLSVTCKEQLDGLCNRFLENLPPNEYDIRETFEYAMCLPESYYGEGSYSQWFRAGCALRNTSNNLFICWLALSAKMSTFQYSDVRDLYAKWLRFDMESQGGLTKRSIMHWVKKDAPDKFYEVRRNSIDYYVELTLESKIGDIGNSDKRPMGCGDFDLAMVLYQLMKDQYVCASVKHGIWYQFANHRWKANDSGTTLRKCISEEIRNLYSAKAAKLMEISAHATDEERAINLNKKAQRCIEIITRLGKTNDKKNIMTESKELFYDNKFLESLDINPYLLCFTNGVWDFKEKIFREGRPEDYISMSTNIEYVAIDRSKDAGIMEEINDFMGKLFPVEELKTYMWEHLASTLMGTTPNQTFNNYIGIGQNGKSVLVTLMEKILGDYKGDVPLTLVTQARTKIGGVAPELVALKGIRYAVMQEPSKDDRINEGIMKQLTSGLDQIQARGLYMIDAMKFLPQFKLVVCANYLLDIKSMDHGTWRRIRVVDFLSLFTKTPTDDDPERPYQYMIDENIISKFDKWKHVFMGMLVECVLVTGGLVTDCPTVLASSNAYKQKQDVVSEFINDMVVSSPGKLLSKTQLNQAFAGWHSGTYGSRGPNAKDVHSSMDKQFGKSTSKGWVGIQIKIQEVQETVFDEEDVLEPELV